METLDELVAAIQRDIGVNKPQAALDRLHTYCMKKFAHLIEARSGSCDKEEPLHSRAGKYIKQLEAQAQLQPISAKIMKSSISIFAKRILITFFMGSKEMRLRLVQKPKIKRRKVHLFDDFFPES